jgi:thioredoxin-related protein
MINKIFSVFLISITAISMAQAQNRADMFDWKPLAEAMELAEQNNKKVLVYANAVWCIYCKKVEKEVFTLESVQQKTKEHFYPVWIDIESDEKLTFRGEEMTQIQFSRLMRVTGTPTFIFFDSEGEIIAGQPGFIPEEMYLQILEFVGSDAYLDQSFGEFAGIEAEN